MKKLILAAAMMISFLGFSFAQTTTATKAEKQASHKKAEANSTVGKVKSAAKQTKADVKSSAKEAKSAVKEPVTKKDGTLDKRYKSSAATTTVSN